METIIFFYRKRGLEHPLIEAVGQGSYVLVKAGMEAGKDSWFGRTVSGGEAVFADGKAEYAGGEKAFTGKEVESTGRGKAFTGKEVESTGRGKAFTGGKTLIPAVKALFMKRPKLGEIRERYAQKKHIKQMERQRAQDEERRKQEILQVQEEMQMMCSRIFSLIEDRADCACVYGDGLKSCLQGGGEIGRLWRECWNVEEFRDGFSLRWVRLLLPEAVCHHFVVLGTAPCIPEVLEECARRMKSLRWVLEKDFLESHEEELEDFAENFYEENGLAVSLEPVSGKRGYWSIRSDGRECVNVLDFTGGDGCFTGAAEGSVWLDMGASEEKYRRIRQRSSGVRYVSLKELWRQTQKQWDCLDTVGKSGYNTQKNW